MAWTQESLATERLVLRPFRESDRPTVVTLLTNPEVRRYLGGPVDLSEDFASHPLGEQPNVWAVEVADTAETVGSCSFKDDRGELELSYSFVPSARGRGYASEACAAALDWAWTTTDAARIIAVTQSANTLSVALLARLGFVETDRFEEYDAEQGLFELTRPPAMT
jgi:RimJ/RimL family protein N-acetyltransferase